MTDAAFLEMRAGLVRRGLLTEDFGLTDAGRACCAAQIEVLKASEAPSEPDRPRVFWNLTRRKRAA